MNKFTELTPRQEWLYEFLKVRTENDPYGITTQECIVFNYNMTHDNDRYTMTDNPHAHDKCSSIWKDIDCINRSMRKDKPIIAKNFTYKVATSREEVEDYANKYLIDGLRKLKRYHSIMAKVRRDGQGKCISNADRPIDEKSKAKRFYEAFIEVPMNEEDIDNDLC